MESAAVLQPRRQRLKEELAVSVTGRLQGLLALLL
jgi:hypothetical protein